jgi:aminoglycoside phosphotransferase (APT) family kinase protein
VLALGDVAGYLLGRGLLGPEAIVDGGLRIADVSRRNRVFLATTQRDRCFVLKLGRQGAPDAVAREAAVLKRLHAADAVLARSLPPLVGWDAARGVLILGATRDAQELAQVHGGGRCSLALARAAGSALARLHDLPACAAPASASTGASAAGALGADDDGDRAADRRPPAVHRLELGDLATLSGAAIDLVRIVQRDTQLCDELDGLATSTEDRAVIHGDVRWANCLALRDAGGRRTRLVLIDWELCRMGDPAADVGAFLGDWLRAWLKSIPVSDPREPARLLAHARFPLARMRPAIGAFWDAYRRRRARPSAELSDALRRATRFAAVRLLESAFEEAQTHPALQATTLHQQQLCRNIIRRPDDAAAHLLGLPRSRA